MESKRESPQPWKTGGLTDGSGLLAALCSSPRRGPNFPLFLGGQLFPMLRHPKEEFAVLFMVCVSCVPFALAGVV